jgi:hypothetical protein
MSLEEIMDSANKKAVEAATQKFGPRATPIAEEIANKTEEEVAKKMGVPLQPPTASAENNNKQP